MKIPIYCVTEEMTFFPRTSKDPITLAKYAEIKPIWNEGFLPSHLKEELKEAESKQNEHLPYNKPHTNDKFVMCIYGEHWLAIRAKLIKEK